MKYIKLFKNDAEYQAFKGGDYITPNLCLNSETWETKCEPEKDDLIFPLYIENFELIEEHLFQSIYINYGNYTKLVKVLSEFVINNGINYESYNTVLENLNNYGIEIYVNYEGFWEQINSLRIAFGNLYAATKNGEMEIGNDMIILTIDIYIEEF